MFTQTGDFIEYSWKEALKDIIKKKSKSKFILDINIFKGYFIILQKYIINRVLRELSLYEKGVNYKIPDKIIELIRMEKTGKVVTLSPDFRAYIDRDELIICREQVYNDEFSIVVNNEYDFLDGKLRFESKIKDHHENGFSGKDEYWDEIIDYDRIDENSILLRFWKDGDAFVPLGMKENKKVSDFFTDEKIPLWKKKSIPMLISGNEIVWICGYRISDKVKIKKDTRKILCLRCRLNKDE